jgi:hypothetical protein
MNPSTADTYALRLHRPTRDAEVRTDAFTLALTAP